MQRELFLEWNINHDNAKIARMIFFSHKVVYLSLVTILIHSIFFHTCLVDDELNEGRKKTENTCCRLDSLKLQSDSIQILDVKIK